MTQPYTTQLEVYDPGNEYAVNWMWGTTALGFNKTKIDALLPNAPYDSWDLLLDPKNAKVISECGIAIVDSAEDFMQGVMISMGFDPNDHSLEDLAAAKEKILGIRQYVRYFETARYINDLANGEICLVVAYSGDVLQARDRAAEANFTDEIVYSIPKEGAVIWMDNLVIPSDAKNVEEAHEFINFFLRPQITADISNYVYYANSNLAATELVVDEVKNDPGIYPPPEIAATLKATRLGSQEYFRELTSTWTDIKTAVQ